MTKSSTRPGRPNRRVNLWACVALRIDVHRITGVVAVEDATEIGIDVPKYVTIGFNRRAINAYEIATIFDCPRTEDWPIVDGRLSKGVTRSRHLRCLSSGFEDTLP